MTFCGIYPGWKRGELLITAEHEGWDATGGGAGGWMQVGEGQKSRLLIAASSFAVMSKGQPRR